MKIRDIPPQSFLKSILDYSPDTGIFYWKTRNDISPIQNTRWTGKGAGAKNKKSIKIIFNDVQYPAHRLAWVYVYGDVLNENIQIDHRNNNCYDNRINNLREASHSQNCSNARKWAKKSLPKGVGTQTNDASKFRARIQVGKKVVHLGTFPTPEEAHAAYCEAAKTYHGEFARAS